MSESKEIEINQVSETIAFSLLDDGPKAENYIAQVGRAVIDSEESMQAATSLMSFMKKLNKKLEDTRKAITAPLRNTTTTVNAEFKKVTGPLANAQTQLNAKMLDYTKEQMRLREEQERKEREEREAAALAAAEKADTEEEQEAIMETAIEAREVTTKVETVQGVAGGAAYTQEVWKGQVIDYKAFFEGLASGDLPKNLVTISQSGLNRMASSHKEEKVKHGIQLKKETRLATRS